jgi:hypothetical protein
LNSEHHRRFLQTGLPHLPRIGVADAVAIGGAIAPSLAVFAPHGFAPRLAVLAVFIVILDGGRSLRVWRLPFGLTLPLAMLSVWGLTSTAWSTVPQQGFIEGLRFTAISAGGLFLLCAVNSLTAAERRRIRRMMVVGIILGIVLLLVERFSGAALTRLVLQPSGGSRYCR